MQNLHYVYSGSACLDSTARRNYKKTSGQDAGVGRYIHFASLHNQKMDNKFKNKKQPELPENQTVWKFDNQGVKEETFIQTGRSGADKQLWRRGLGAKWQLEDWGRQGSGWWSRQAGPTLVSG